MTDVRPPSLLRRLLPWLIAIAVGVGVGWWVGSAFAPASDEAGRSASSSEATAPAPPPASPAGRPQLPPAAPPRPLGPPIALSISNRDCAWGAEYDAYYRQAATILLHTGRQAGREAESVRFRVPDRPWNGLTVTAVEAIYEGSGIIFAEPVTDVRAALVRAGVRVAADGGIPLDDANDAVAVQAIRATEGSARRYGATVLTCGA